MALRRIAAAAGAFMVMLSAAGSTAAGGQLGALASPGPLSKPHAALEGIRQCQRCHEPGRGVSAARCLECHEPVARRIAAGRGVHRSVRADCVSCHVEHMGRDAELRPFDTRGFDHAREAGYPIDGRHARLAADCAACHKTRSFLTASPACGSCHADPHRGSLGASCERCHSTKAAFSAALKSFDHSRTAFPLAGAHKELSCTACHAGSTYRDRTGATCASCHQDPHVPRAAGPAERTRPTGRRTAGPAERTRPAGRFGRRCESCHTSATWRTTRVDHDRTRYPLLGRHAGVACARCHVQPAMKVAPPSDRCAACHSDPHAGAFRQDCAACHSERGFAGAPFDHARTAFPLTGGHARVPCAGCHTTKAATAGSAPKPVVAFGGLTGTCASCHADPHGSELGATCGTCHTTASFKVAAYTHRQGGAFFEAGHSQVPCGRCHVPAVPQQPMRTGVPLRVTYAGTPRTCAACHADVHLGQVGRACESCHSVAAPRFAAAGFSHDRAKFRLEGSHRTVACDRCHKPETGRFPSGSGTAVRLAGMEIACAACHEDVHAGQLTRSCEACHTAASFRIEHYTHLNPSLRAFFGGPHASVRCAQCHPPAPAQPGGAAARVARYRIETRCASCHTDPHRGQLGDRCGDCHRVGVRR